MEPAVTAGHPGAHVDAATGEVTFRVAPDPHWRPRRVWFHLREFGADPTFRREGAAWVARIPRPPVQRMEYLLVVESTSGAESIVLDPGNPHRVRGVFGDHSLIEMPGYRPPWWIAVADATEAQARRDAQAREAATRRAAGERGTPWLRAQQLAPTSGQLVPVPGGTAHPTGEGITSIGHARRPVHDERRRRETVWVPDGTAALVPDTGTDPDPVVDADAAVTVSGNLHVPSDSVPDEGLPLLVVHDGPEYADLGQLLRYLTTLGRMDRALRCRVLLLTPVDRDRSYSASPAYARALVEGMLPGIVGSVRTTGPLVGLGASLGGLALLHAALAHPGTFGGILSQSGSFFRPRTDSKESGYRHFHRIVEFVDGVDADPKRLAGLRVAMTCGTGEENLANNRSLARRLERLGVPVGLVENPDGHNYTGWRDSLDPSLRDLLRRVWAEQG